MLIKSEHFSELEENYWSLFLTFPGGNYQQLEQ